MKKYAYSSIIFCLLFFPHNLHADNIVIAPSVTAVTKEETVLKNIPFHVGAKGVFPKQIIIEGKKVSFISFPEKQLSAKNASDVLAQEVMNVKKDNDVVFVIFDWGTSLRAKQTTSDERILAARAIDSGADGIIGFVPRTIRSVEFYKTKPIFYSVGSKGALAIGESKLALSISLKGQTPLVDIYTVTRGRTFTIREYRDTDALRTTAQRNFTCPVSSAFPLTFVSLPTAGTLGKYVPSGLMQVPLQYATVGRLLCLEQETLKAFTQMNTAMKKEGFGIRINSAYRSSAEQAVFAERFSENPERVAEIGQSEHQLGTAIDVGSATTGEMFYLSAEYVWMKEHAHKYGFVQSYPEGILEKTGQAYEPWHWRYVGIEKAQQVKLSGLPLNLFLKQ
jgi:zinc D-Ala-D-Ala carboxypeptidase